MTLDKIRSDIRVYLPLAVIIFLVAIGLYYFFAQGLKPLNQTTLPDISIDEIPSSPDQDLSRFVNQNTTRQAVIDDLGEPVKEIDITSGIKALEYPSNNEYRFHQVYVSGETPVLIKQQITQINGPTRDTIGLRNPDTIRYTYRFGDVAPLYIDSNQGIAAVAHQKDGVIYEIWYFDPLNYNGFLNAISSETTTDIEKVDSHE